MLLRIIDNIHSGVCFVTSRIDRVSNIRTKMRVKYEEREREREYCYRKQ